jgi:hypothetical protein
MAAAPVNQTGQRHNPEPGRAIGCGVPMIGASTAPPDLGGHSGVTVGHARTARVEKENSRPSRSLVVLERA